MNTQQTIDTIHTNLFKFGANVQKMNVLEMYDFLVHTNSLTQDTLVELKKLFKIQMMQNTNCYIEYEDIANELDVVNLYVYGDMFDWVFKTYGSIVIECGNNRKEALTRITNKFVEVCRMWLGIELTYSFAVHVIQNLLFGYHYKRKHYYSQNESSFMFMYEVIVRA